MTGFTKIQNSQMIRSIALGFIRVMRRKRIISLTNEMEYAKIFASEGADIGVSRHLSGDITPTASHTSPQLHHVKAPKIDIQTYYEEIFYATYHSRESSCPQSYSSSRIASGKRVSSQQHSNTHCRLLKKNNGIYRSYVRKLVTVMKPNIINGRKRIFFI